MGLLKFYDTNALLTLGESVFDDDSFYISSVSLHELEHIKTDKNKTEDVKFKARRMSRLLDENRDKFVVVHYTDDVSSVIEGYNLATEKDNPDIRICACAKQVDPVIFVSDDICCKNIARNVFGLQVESAKQKTENIYNGYTILEGSTDYINEKMSDLNYKATLYNNEYICIKNTDDDSESEMKFLNGEFLPLKLPPSKYVKGKNALQRCALDILNNPNITIAAILGGYGSGKTYLAMRMGLYWMNEKGTMDKILGVRSPEGEGKEVGFLPGDLEDKTDKFFLPLEQQLEGGEFELASLKQQDKLESTIPFYMKGTTYNHTVILCDEAEDLTQKEIKLVGTRVGEGSRIFFSGDYKQSVVNSTTNNALVEMCNEFKGRPEFACIYLDEDVRSTTSKLFADLFDKES